MNEHDESNVPNVSNVPPPGTQNQDFAACPGLPAPPPNHLPKPIAWWLRRFFACNPFYLVSAALLLYGVFRHTQGARIASGLFVLAATLKVFLYDLAGLQGLMRALSFIGLGLVLIGIGLLYQKLVFGRRPDAGGAPGENPVL